MERTERMKAVGQCFIVSAAVGVCVDRAHQTKAILIADLHLHSLRGLEWNDTEAAGNFTVSVSCLSSNFSPLFRSIYLRTITLNVLFILQRWCVGLSSPPSFGCGHFFLGGGGGGGWGGVYYSISLCNIDSGTGFMPVSLPDAARPIFRAWDPWDWCNPPLCEGSESNV